MTRATHILNATRASTVCERAVLADRPLSRMRGLLGRRELASGEGLLLTPAPAIHTAFMRFAIDALFLDAELRVLRIRARLAPWRAASQRHARFVLELPAGEAARVGVEVGDRLELVDPRPEQPNAPAEPARMGLPETHATVAPAGPDVTETCAPSEPASVEAAAPTAIRRRRSVEDEQAVKPHAGSAYGQLNETSMRVMVLSSDRRFREVASLLLVRRGCVVSLGAGRGTLAERVDRDRTEVVIIDAGQSLAAAARMTAAVEALSRPVGIVVVGDEAQNSLLKLQVIPKWGSFDTLFEAVKQSHSERGHRPSLFERMTEGASR